MLTAEQARAASAAFDSPALAAAFARAEREIADAAGKGKVCTTCYVDEYDHAFNLAWRLRAAGFVAIATDSYSVRVRWDNRPPEPHQ